jgi:arylsulfatase A-like enzyme
MPKFKKKLCLVLLFWVFFLNFLRISDFGFRISFLVLGAESRPAYNEADSEAAKPNILLIVADDLGYADLGCYGCKDIRTPNLDRLAEQGVRLTDFYASAPVCSPTRASLMTGRYPQRFGLDWAIGYREKSRGLAAKGASLPYLLRKRGYATALYGKWHLGYEKQFGPNAHGFEDFFGFLGPDLDYYTHLTALGEPGLYVNTKLTEEKGYMTDLITEHALAYLKRTTRRPFFLEVAYSAPHFPFQAPDRPDDRRTLRTYGPELGTRSDYVKMVERIDEGIGKLLAALEKTSRERDTFVIFLSDNGGERLSDNTPFFHGKYALWEGGIRVPCILRWPGVLPTKTVSRQPTIVMDLTASMLAAGGASLPEGTLDGEDLVPLLSAKKPARERTFYWRLPRPDEYFGQKAVRRGRWKYVYDRESELMFDLEKDSSEKRNVAFQHPDEVRTLRAALAEWESHLPAVRP